MDAIPVFSPSSSELVQQLLRAPWLPQVVHQLEDVLRLENEKRQLFYDEISEAHKAEFINGEIVVHSPAKLRHSLARKHLTMLLTTYAQKHHLGLIGDEKLLVTLTRNDYEPDICFFTAEKAQGFSLDQMKFPAPDFVVEVLSSSTEAVDRGVKFADYALHGVREYWLVDADQETVEQYVLADATYTLYAKIRQGSIQSQQVAGFEISLRAIFDPAENLMALQHLLAA